jgi:hypothetical protein
MATNTKGKNELEAMVDGNKVILGGRTFSTGSDGYHWAGKMTINGVPYQVNLLATRIGSKK